MGGRYCVHDAYSGENFKMRVMLICTINEFLVYNNLSCYIVKGHKVCPICDVDTCYHQLINEKNYLPWEFQNFKSQSFIV